MATQTSKPFDSTIQKTNEWLNELMREIGTDDQKEAYHALRLVLHALRDLLSVEEAADLGAQLPLLIRGLYYEGWQPATVPLRERKREDFIDHIRRGLKEDQWIDAAAMSQAVFRLLSNRVSAGEIEDVRMSLPKDLRELWEE